MTKKDSIYVGFIAGAFVFMLVMQHATAETKYKLGLLRGYNASLEEVMKVHDAKCGPETWKTNDNPFCDAVSEIGLNIIHRKESRGWMDNERTSAVAYDK